MKKSKKRKGAPDEHHGVNSYHHMQGDVKHPHDHEAHDIPNPDGGLHEGTNLGTNAPMKFEAPQTMQGPAQYPGQELGA